MSEQDRNKWNQRYAEDSYRKNNPVTLVEDWLAKLPPGRALDIACGAGRNAILLAQAGYEVDAIDISQQGLKQGRQRAAALGLAINWIEHDFDDTYDFDTDYNVILVMWYVNLELITRLSECLAPGGYLLCEEHLRSDQQTAGPANPDYRVAPGALRAAVSGAGILFYEESVHQNSVGEPIASAGLVFRNQPSPD